MAQRKRDFIFIFLPLILFMFIFDELQAQTQPVLNFRNRGAQYQIGREDELLIKVNIWGFVRMPGQYLVPSDTDLISLISYAGGPVEGAQTKKIKLVRTTTINPDGKSLNTNQKIYNYNIKQFLETGDMSLNPQLMPNDTIVISGSTVHLISKVLEFASKIGFFVQLWYWWKISQRY